MTNKEIVQEISKGKGLLSMLAKQCKTKCDIDEFINMLIDQHRDAPQGLKKIIGKELFKEVENIKNQRIMKAHTLIEHDELKITVRGQGYKFKKWHLFRDAVNAILTMDQCHKMMYEENPVNQFSIEVDKLKKVGLIK